MMFTGIALPAFKNCLTCHKTQQKSHHHAQILRCTGTYFKNDVLVGDKQAKEADNFEVFESRVEDVGCTRSEHTTEENHPTCNKNHWFEATKI